MTKRFCDKCGRELQPVFGIVGWWLTVTVKDILTPERSADLCPDCQKAVYRFVFGESAE